MYNDDISDNAKEKLAKLKTIFWEVLDYLGDDELISNVNTEYEFDQDDVIRTDGSINFHINLVNSNTGPYICYRVCVRGGTYLIYADKCNGAWRYQLRVNRPAIEEKYDEIIRQYEDMKKHMGDMDYYITDWRDNNCIIHDTMSLDDVNCL